MTLYKLLVDKTNHTLPHRTLLHPPRRHCPTNQPLLLLRRQRSHQHYDHVPPAEADLDPPSSSGTETCNCNTVQHRYRLRRHGGCASCANRVPGEKQQHPFQLVAGILGDD